MPVKYDVIVVGAGSAGCSLASRLTEDPGRSVLLLEAGPDYADLNALPGPVRDGNDQSPGDEDSPHNWSFVGRATGRRDRAMPVPRGKLIGGSSSVNGQVFLRGIPEDFDSWESQGNAEWGYLKVLPYFRKMERDLDIRDDFHGTDGPIPIRRHRRDSLAPVQRAFLEACVGTGFSEVADMNSPQCTGVGLIPMNQANGVRMSTFLTHLEPSRHRLNLTVRGKVLARKVLFDGKRAVGVQVESGGQTFTVEGSEIVLSAGAIGSPHLLMLSGVGPVGDLARAGVPVVHDLPGVGENMRDHPAVDVRARVKEDVVLEENTPRVQFILRFTSRESGTRNDIHLLPHSFHGPRIGTDAGAGGFVIDCQVQLELAAGAGRMRLASSDPRVQPELDYHFLEDPWDLQRLREAVRVAVGILEHPAYRDIVEERVWPEDEHLQSDDNLDAWLLEHVTTCQHISGTCKMGPSSDPMAVVDQYGRVRGLEGLRVADASIMPDVVRANTNATSIMIGERISDWLGSPT